MHSEDSLQEGLQVDKHVGFGHALEHLLQFLILVLQQGVPAKEKLDIVDTINIVTKRIFFIVLILLFNNN